MPYFSLNEAELLKKAHINGHHTLEQVIKEVLIEPIERRLKKRIKSEDFLVCAAHELASD
jgi:hypothetical protein